MSDVILIFASLLFGIGAMALAVASITSILNKLNVIEYSSRQYWKYTGVSFAGGLLLVLIASLI